MANLLKNPQTENTDVLQRLSAGCISATAWEKLRSDPELLYRWTRYLNAGCPEVQLMDEGDEVKIFPIEATHGNWPAGPLLMKCAPHTNPFTRDRLTERVKKQQCLVDQDVSLTVYLAYFAWSSYSLHDVLTWGDDRALAPASLFTILCLAAEYGRNMTRYMGLESHMRLVCDPQLEEPAELYLTHELQMFKFPREHLGSSGISGALTRSGSEQGHSSYCFAFVDD